MIFTKNQLEIIKYCLSKYLERLGNDGCNDLTIEEKALLMQENPNDLMLFFGRKGSEGTIDQVFVDNYSLPEYIIKLINEQQ